MRRATVAVIASSVLAAVLAAAASSAGTTTERLALGDVFVAKGQTGIRPGSTHRATGIVVVRGRWGSGAWKVLTTTRTDAAGRYRFAVTPHRRGLLSIRISPPDEHAQHFVLRVR